MQVAFVIRLNGMATCPYGVSWWTKKEWNQSVIMAALCSGCGHYIFVLFLLSFFVSSSPNLSGHRLDVYYTSTHGVALVRI